MIVNQKATGKAVSMPMGLLAGCGVSMLITLIAAALLARLLDSEKLAWENVGYGIEAALVLASFCGSMTAFRKIKRQRLVICAVCGVMYFCILLGLTALFFGGQYESVWLTAGLILAGSGAAALLGLHGEGKGKRKKIKLRNR